MSVYVVGPRTGVIKDACERSPNIAIATDATLAERIPASIRAAGQYLWTEELASAFARNMPPAADGVVIYLDGEQLLQGETSDVRRSFFFTPGRVSHVAVHLPGIPGADLVSLQPRAFAAGAERNYVNLSWRLAWNAVNFSGSPSRPDDKHSTLGPPLPRTARRASPTWSKHRRHEEDLAD